MATTRSRKPLPALTLDPAAEALGDAGLGDVWTDGEEIRVYASGGDYTAVRVVYGDRYEVAKAGRRRAAYRRDQVKDALRAAGLRVH